MLTSWRHATRRRKTTLSAAVAGALLAIALSVVTLSAGSSGASVTPGAAIPAAAVPAMRTNMLELSRYMGDAHPTSVDAVLANRARALLAVSPDDKVPGSAGQTVYLIVLVGHFTDDNASVPSGAKIPTGRYLAVTINPATWAVEDLSLSNRAPTVSLGSYGPMDALVG